MLTRKHKILTRKDKRNRKSKRKYSRTMNKYDTVFLKKIGQVDGNSKYPIYDVKMLEKHYYISLFLYHVFVYLLHYQYMSL